MSTPAKTTKAKVSKVKVSTAANKRRVEKVKEKLDPVHGPQLQKVIERLTSLQASRSRATKIKNMGENYLAALVASGLGYHTRRGEDGKAVLSEAERKALHQRARKLLHRVGKNIRLKKAGAPCIEVDCPYPDIVEVGMESQLAWEALIERYKEQMEALALCLPVASWVLEDEQHGFGLDSLAVLVGEVGKDLREYASPAKLWKRFGCAPYSSGGQTRMGSAWRKYHAQGKLSAGEWEEFGYSPRRRSVAYIWGTNLMKLNKGAYRRRYEEKKEQMLAEHAGDPAYTRGRADRHGMLLATKLLLKNLWRAWRDAAKYPKDSD